MDEILKSLIIKLRGGDTEAFNYFYRTYYSRLFNFANSYCRNHFVAGNIVQDTFTFLWENREKIDPGTNLPAYLLTMVKNKSFNHLQHLVVKLKVEEQVQNDAMRELELRSSMLSSCNPSEMFHADVESIIEKTMNSFSPQCKRVISMSRFDGLSNKQIATNLDISVKAVEFHITKALKVFRKNLKDYLSILILYLIGSSI